MSDMIIPGDTLIGGIYSDYMPPILSAVCPSGNYGKSEYRVS